ncbi:MAG: TonB-dependent receptor plug domain-containing protein, partial [Steroidobacteraceae bacterium]
MSNVYRKHPLSIAISMALLAAAATSAMASEQTNASAENAGAQDSAQQDGATTPSPGATKPKSATGSVGPDAPAKGADELQEVTVTGVRESQIRAIEVKRLAPSIQDSVSAENIGQFSDVTITDALQRITGVQINRDAGVGSSVDVRGLPQVGTMLNGEVFITPD